MSPEPKMEDNTLPPPPLSHPPKPGTRLHPTLSSFPNQLPQPPETEVKLPLITRETHLDLRPSLTELNPPLMDLSPTLIPPPAEERPHLKPNKPKPRELHTELPPSLTLLPHTEDTAPSPNQLEELPEVPPLLTNTRPPAEDKLEN